MSLLPTEKSPPSMDGTKAKGVLYGIAGIGKTTTVNNMADDVLILACEPGTGGMSAYDPPVPDWKTFLTLGEELSKTDRFSMVAVDTAGALYKMCQDHVCAQHGVTHPSEGDYGIVWDAVKTEFQLRIAKLCNQGRGVVFIAHEREVSYKTRTGVEKRKYAPDIANQGFAFLTGFVDYIIRMEMEVTDGKEVRVLRTQPTTEYEAKQRDTLNLPDPIVIPDNKSTALIDALSSGGKK